MLTLIITQLTTPMTNSDLPEECQKYTTYKARNRHKKNTHYSNKELVSKNP